MFARIENGAVAEIIDFNPAGLYPPEFVWVECPADTEQGSTFDPATGVFTPDPTRSVVSAGDGQPAEPAEPPAPPRRLKLTPAEFRNSFSAFEEVAVVDFAATVDAEDSAYIATLRKVVGVFFDRLKDPHLTTVDLEDPRNLLGLDLLVGVEILTGERREQIAAGLPT
jgi:hypothetical protein